MVERLFLAVPRGCLQFVIVVLPDHTHLLFLCIIVGNVILGLWAIRKIMCVQDRGNVGIVKRLLGTIINAIFQVMNVNLR